MLSEVGGVFIVRRGVTIHKGHDSVRTSVFKSRVGMFFGTEDKNTKSRT